MSDPSTPHIPLRRLTEDDADAFRAIRLRMLADHPAWFGASLAEETAQPPAFFAARLAASPMLGAFDADGVLCATCGFYRQTGTKQRHKGTVWAVYVDPDHRGQGLAEALLAALIEAARAEVETLTLTVAADNGPARRLYERFGFQPYAHEPAGLKVGDVYYDEILMRLPLDAAATGDKQT